VKLDKTIDDTRDRAREAINQAHLTVDPERALWPPAAPIQRSEQHSAALSAHSAVLSYQAQLPPIHRDGKRWDEEIAKHEFPDGTTLGVSLATIDRWRDINYTDASSDIRRVLLPVAYARELFRQTDRIAQNAGLVDSEADSIDREQYR
jgi:hypothetical protein